jgi:hypothetical protein
MGFNYHPQSAEQSAPRLALVPIKERDNMTQDRNYLRMLSDGELVGVALDRNHELAVVLAERLSELLNVEAELEDAKKLIDELSDSRDKWIEETVSLQSQVYEWRAEANNVQAQLDVINIGKSK